MVSLVEQSLKLEHQIKVEHFCWQVLHQKEKELAEMSRRHCYLGSDYQRGF